MTDKSYRVGLLVPSSNTTVEPEFYRALPASVTLHTARMFLTDITPEAILRIVQDLESQSRLLATADVDVIVLACTNWRSMDSIEKLERELGKPVLSTTQVSVWDALRIVGYRGEVAGYGRLLRTLGEKERIAAVA